MWFEFYCMYRWLILRTTVVLMLLCWPILPAAVTKNNPTIKRIYRGPSVQQRWSSEQNKCHLASCCKKLFTMLNSHLISLGNKKKAYSSENLAPFISTINLAAQPQTPFPAFYIHENLSSVATKMSRQRWLSASTVSLLADIGSALWKHVFSMMDLLKHIIGAPPMLD